MKLTLLKLEMNQYSYEHDGVAPNGYGAVAFFEGIDGSMRVKLQPNTVQRILECIAENAADKACDLASTITVTSIVNSANILEHMPVPGQVF